ncbi:hypothetical protein U456_02448 [Staphylococcus aureus W55442]|nr:hypothetical protein U456_02448 [Staphylococcus aureus W55442]
MNSTLQQNPSDSIQKVGEEFNQTDVMIGNEIGKN